MSIIDDDLHTDGYALHSCQAPKAWQDIARANAAESAGSFMVTQDVEVGLREADFVYTDLWWWIGQQAEIPDRQRAFMPTYQVNGKLLARAPVHAKFMHCLPAARDVEVTDPVRDGPQSILYEQAENRLHTKKGLLGYFVYPRLKTPSPGVAAGYCRQVENFLKGSPEAQQLLKGGERWPAPRRTWR